MSAEMTPEEMQERFRPLRIWRSLSGETRKEAALAFWTSDQVKEIEKAAAIDALATAMRFRPQTIRQAPPAKRAGFLAGSNALTDHVAGTILFIYHIERKVPLMSKFLDALGINHEEGRIEDEVDPPTEEALEKAVDEILKEHERAEVITYMETLLSQDDGTWAGLVPVLQKIAPSVESE